MIVDDEQRGERADQAQVRERILGTAAGGRGVLGHGGHEAVDAMGSAAGTEGRIVPGFSQTKIARTLQRRRSRAHSPARAALLRRARRLVLRLIVPALFAASPAASAPPPPDAPLAPVRSWNLDGLDPGGVRPDPAYRVRLELAMVAGSRWSPDVILDAVAGAAKVLAQCGIAVGPVRLQEFAGPARYRQLATRDSREFAQRAGLRRPAVFFVDDTRQDPAFDAEAVGRGNARSRPEMMDTVWITAATRDLPVVLAHELVHVLADSGEHSDAPQNLMRDETTPGNTRLTPAQCARIVSVGTANGLVDAAPTR